MSIWSVSTTDAPDAAHREVRIFGLAGLGVLTFVLSAWAGQALPATGLPTQPEGPRLEIPPAESLVVHGRGTSAAEAFAIATNRLSFAGRPSYLPSGYAPVLAEARVDAVGRAFVDVVYSGQGLQQLQLFQSNSPNLKAIAAPVRVDEQETISGRTWRYLLLAYPQPDGSTLLVHFLERQFDSSSYVALSLGSGGELDPERAELTKIAASLR